LELLRPSLRVVVVLGAFGWQAAMPALSEAGWLVPRPKPAFAHGGRVVLLPKVAGPNAAGAKTGVAAGSASAGPIEIFGCFHVSHRNTATGRLTPGMLRAVLRTAAQTAGLPSDRLAPASAVPTGSDA
jgi:uracil-DNA glycosylase